MRQLVGAVAPGPAVAPHEFVAKSGDKPPHSKRWRAFRKPVRNRYASGLALPQPFYARGASLIPDNHRYAVVQTKIAA